MSIPLDRLYHHLDSLCDDNVIIYRWYPHGSKKLNDLHRINENKDTQDENALLLGIDLICHDQEPLDYNFYQYEDFLDRAHKLVDRFKIHGLPPPAWTNSDRFLEQLASSQFRVVSRYIINIHDKTLLCHSEKNSPELKLFENNNFIGVYYWSHAVIARDWFRFAEHDKELEIDFDVINKDFLIYNRAWAGTREYRLKFVELLAKQHLIQKCNTKFNSHDQDLHYSSHCFKNTRLAISRFDFEELLEPNTFTSCSSADYNSQDYKTSAVEVILETLFDDQRWHLTEKTLRPIATGRPFILASTPGSLKYLRSYGFKTFDGLINEDYDNIIDPLQRLQFIVDEMVRISSLDTADKISLWKKIYAIANYNKTHFFSPKFQNDIFKEFKHNLNEGLKICRQHAVGSWPKLAAGFEIKKVEMEKIQKIENLLEQINTF